MISWIRSTVHDKWLLLPRINMIRGTRISVTQDWWTNPGWVVSSSRHLGILSSAYNNSGTQSRLSRIVSGIDQSDAEERYNVEAGDNKITSLPDSSATSVDSTRRKIISWERNDPENPYNWSSVRSDNFLGMIFKFARPSRMLPKCVPDGRRSGYF